MKAIPGYLLFLLNDPYKCMHLTDLTTTLCLIIIRAVVGTKVKKSLYFVSLLHTVHFLDSWTSQSEIV